MKLWVFAILLGLTCLSAAAQDVPASAPKTDSNPALVQRPLQREPVATAAKAETLTLAVPKGTALQVALDKEVRVQRVGQPIHGHDRGTGICV